MEQPVRKTLRLQDYDYSSNGAYFVTICTQEKQKLFWCKASPELSDAGILVLSWIKKLSTKFPGVTLDSYAIMPNHIHMILFFQETSFDLPTVMKWLKTMTTNHYFRSVKNGICPPVFKHLWQRSYYDHVIRNSEDLHSIRKYIAENPLKWTLDKLYMP